MAEISIDEYLVDLQWPGPNERLFEGGSPCHFNAIPNWGSAISFDTVAGHYWTAAVALSESVASETVMLDAVIRPIVFLYRQFLELKIKGIIESDFKLDGEAFPYHNYKSHLLSRLWADAKQRLKKRLGGDAPKELAYIDPCIKEFEQHDPQSFAFRYPTDKDGKMCLTEIRYIHLGRLHETMNRIHSLLDSMAWCLGAMRDQRAEYDLQY